MKKVFILLLIQTIAIQLVSAEEKHLVKISLSTPFIVRKLSSIKNPQKQKTLEIDGQDFMQYIPPTTFDAFTNLEELTIEYASTKKLRNGTFDNTKKLTTLTIINNVNLHLLGKQLFQGLENLTELNLKGNKLTKLPAKLFEDLKKLRTLNLKDNQLTELDPKLFKALDELKMLFIKGNNLSDSNIAELKKALPMVNIFG